MIAKHIAPACMFPEVDDSGQRFALFAHLGTVRQLAASLESTLVEAALGLPPALRPSAWTGHVPFLLALMRIARPRTFVQLGITDGGAFVAACGAARTYETDTLCYGVRRPGQPTVEGDEAFDRLVHYATSLYPAAKMLDAADAETAVQFPDGTIDLLSIDGSLDYDQTSLEYHAWSRKMSGTGVVLLHDIAVHAEGFDVWRLWEELRERFPSMAFDHSFGLGVLFVGPDLSPSLAQLSQRISTEPNYQEMLRSLCEAAAATMPERLVARERAGVASGTGDHSPDAMTATLARNLVNRSKAWRLLWPLLRRFRGFSDLEKSVR